MGIHETALSCCRVLVRRYRTVSLRYECEAGNVRWRCGHTPGVLLQQRRSTYTHVRDPSDQPSPAGFGLTEIRHYSNMFPPDWKI